MRVENIRRIAVVGAGTMGHGIAQVGAEAGYMVSLRDVEEESLQRAMKRIALNLEKFVDEGLTDEAKTRSVLSHIVTTIDMNEAVSDADIVFEAIPERMDLKKAMWRQIDGLCPHHAIMASNTSSLSITELALATRRADKFVGTHWMLPPHIRPLVEIVRGANTSDETVDFMKDFFRRLGKITVVCKDSPGFIVNRMQAAMIREAISLVEQGLCDMRDIDLVWTHHLGLRYCLEGPFEYLDHSGLDTWHSVFSYLYNELRDSKFRPPASLRRKVDAGELGLKTGKGFYDYSGKSIDAIINDRDKKLLHLLDAMKKL
jgi:3-hydroxybutyryl-CoA dehydrogenase